MSDTVKSLLREWLDYAEINLSEFDNDDEDCDSENYVCPRCRSNGCLQSKIRRTRAALELANKAEE